MPELNGTGALRVKVREPDEEWVLAVPVLEWDEVVVVDTVSVAGDPFLPKTNSPLWKTKKKCSKKY